MSVQPSKRVLEAVGGVICHDLKRGKECLHCAEKAWRIAVRVLEAQEEDRAKNAQEALDRVAGPFLGVKVAV